MRIPTQHVPNLAHHAIVHKEGIGVIHYKCNGLLIRAGGRTRDETSGIPRNAPGKIFCSTCGCKVGRSVTALLKNDSERESLYGLGGGLELNVGVYVTDLKGGGQGFYQFWYWSKIKKVSRSEHDAPVLIGRKKS